MERKYQVSVLHMHGFSPVEVEVRDDLASFIVTVSQLLVRYAAAIQAGHIELSIRWR